MWCRRRTVRARERGRKKGGEKEEMEEPRVTTANVCEYGITCARVRWGRECEWDDGLEKGIKEAVRGPGESSERHGERNEKECNKLAVRLFSTCIKTSSGDGRLGKYCPTPRLRWAKLTSFILHLFLLVYGFTLEFWCTSVSLTSTFPLGIGILYFLVRLLWPLHKWTFWLWWSTWRATPRKLCLTLIRRGVNRLIWIR